MKAAPCFVTLPQDREQVFRTYETMNCEPCSSELDPCLKELFPVFLTPREYLQNHGIANESLYEKDNVTVINTLPTIHPFEGCPYLSFQQLSPALGADNSLSWVITPNPGQEVIQFLTSQINYTIQWELTAILEPTRDEHVTLLLVTSDRSSTVPTPMAFEPWDINGNRIRFEIPKRRGCTTTGEFVLPGAYGQFIIESTTLDGLSPVPGYTLVMKLKIIGNRDTTCDRVTIDPWAASLPDEAFCVFSGYSRENCAVPSLNMPSKCKPCRGTPCTNPVYRNVKVTDGILRREVLPEYQWLQSLVELKYRQNPRLPCFKGEIGEVEGDALGPYRIDLRSNYYREDGYSVNWNNTQLEVAYRYGVTPDDCSTEIEYTYPDLVSISGGDLVTSAGPNAFRLKPLAPTQLYKISFNITVQSMAFSQLDINIPNVLGSDFDGPVTPLCSPDQLRLIFSNGDTINYVADKSNPYPGSSPSIVAVTLASLTLVGSPTSEDSYLLSNTQMFDGSTNIATYYYAFSASTTDTFSMSVYNTLWSYPVTRDGQSLRINVGGAWLVEISINLSVIAS